MTAPWEHNWRAFAKERLHELGYASLREFADERPSATFIQLSVEFGSGNLAPVQIQELLKEEALTDGRSAEYLRDSLVRYLHEHVPKGIQCHGEWALVLALSSWAGSTGPALQSQSGRVAKAIKNLPAEYADWIPCSPRDEKLDEMFRAEGL